MVGLSHIMISGNVRSFYVARNAFQGNYAPGRSDTSICAQGGVQVGANDDFGTTTATDVPTGGIFDANRFIGLFGYSIYLQGTNGMLVQRNDFESVGDGVGVFTEPQYNESSTHDPATIAIAQNTWIRDNTFLNFRQAGVQFGRWNSNYHTVQDTYVTNNTFYTINQQLNPESVAIIARSENEGGAQSDALPDYIGINAIENNVVMVNGAALAVKNLGLPATNPNTMSVANNALYGSTLYEGISSAPDVVAMQIPSPTHASVFSVCSSLYEPIWPAAGCQSQQDFALAGPVSPLVDAGATIAPSWVTNAYTFGAFDPCGGGQCQDEQYDVYGAPRLNGKVDLGASEWYCSADTDCGSGQHCIWAPTGQMSCQ
jgi:hypothetical protein